MTYYNIDFDIAALVIMVILAGYYFKLKHFPSRTNRIFVAMMIFAILVPLADIPACITIEQQAGRFATILANTLYYISKMTAFYLFMMYVIYQLDMDAPETKRQKIWVTVPYAAMMLITLTNPVTGLLFTYDGAEYHSGLLRRTYYAVCVFFFLIAVVYIFINKRLFRKRTRLITYMICAVNVLPNFVQYLVPRLMLAGISLAVTILLLVLTMEGQDNFLDPVSGMMKRGYLEAGWERLIYNRIPFSMVMVKIADYDMLEATYGIASAEALSGKLASHLREYAAPGYSFRTGEDHFVLLIRKTSHPDTEALKKHLLETLGNEMDLGEIELGYDLYISSVDCPKDAPDIESLKAYRSHFETAAFKKSGIVNLADFNVQNQMRFKQVEKAIESAIENDSFELYYQPICRADNREYISAEALIRLKDPELGFIPPSEFIPIAEETGHILKIGAIVLDKVCRFVAEHDMEKLGLKYIEFNLSTIQCLQGNFSRTIENALKRYDVSPKYLAAEITETASNSAPVIFTSNLEYLSRRGFLLALDDFGSGYSNLQRLVTSKFGIIKFDRDMTARLTKDEDLRKVCRIMVNMLHSMGSRIVSEGVETAEQYEFLRGLGCEYIQGWYFSKALPEQDFVKFIEKNRVVA